MADEKAERYIRSSSEADARAYAVNYGVHKEGMTKEEIAEYYSDWAKKGTYDNDLGPERYQGPQYAADVLSKYFNANRATVKVLDVASGTGLLGDKLFQMGFRNIDALDPAEGMLSVARKKNSYKDYLCEFMDGHKLDIQNDTYDCVVVSGGMGEGHIPCKAIPEMIRIAKPGGLVCIVMREEFLSYVKEYIDRLEPLFKKLEEEGKWQSISRIIVPRFYCNKDGVIFQYKVL
ncbi:hypothetical protein ScPMuIL_015664 [Solemya velum]